METYQGKVNEFVDWVSGINTVTGNVIDGVDEDHPISGKSIRELVQKKLKTPFITYKDDKAGYIRFFSSEEAKRIWEGYMQNNDLENAEEYVLYSMDLPATYKITGLDSFLQARYIIEGNSNSDNAVLSYTLGLEDSLGEPDSDVISVTYTIKDSSENVTYNEGYQISTGDSVTKNIYQYLRSGENKITIKATANNHNAQTTRTFSVYLVTFSISSNFIGYYTGIANGRAFSFDVAVQRSITNLPVTTNIYISEDGSKSQTPVTTWRYTDSSSNPSKRFEIPNTYLASDYDQSRKYRMIIQSQMNDAESQTSFDSNVLVYEFEIASNLGDLTNGFVNCAYSVSNSNYSYLDSGKVILQATQYMPFTFDWGYYTDAGSQQVDINWNLRTGVEGSYEYTELVNILGAKGLKPTSLSFIPSTPMSFEKDNSYLVARINGQDIEEFPINISENNIDVSETGNYALKLSAYGKTNSSESKNQWTDFEHNITTTFSSGVTFDNSNGWDNNSLVLKGLDSYATINYCPFPETLEGNQYNVSDNGAAFEIDFKPEQVNSEDDVLLTIGDTSKGYIAITPTGAAFYEGSNTPTIKTNFKAGERIKLCFIFNRYSEISNDSNLIYIVNNGILERAAVKGNASINSFAGNIKIGGSRSGVRLYSIRAYRQDISPKQALDNYMFDNISDSSLISRNDIYDNSSTITYAGMQGKQDLIIIEGNLDNILNNAQSKKNATVSITRESNIDPSKNFTITDCRIRNHGQSTLSYPITSMKIWLNKSNKFYESNGVVQEYVPELICNSQAYLGLNKNRYIMKDGAIPANKFVLQANYADSSGTHNGSLLRLIQDTWYNASIDGEYKLRTAPQLFTSGAKITHNNPNLNEDGSWIDGYYNLTNSQKGYSKDRVGKTWPEITNSDFPYIIRNAADSFPCTVFYRDTSSQNQALTLLGQYVFMDDKKSDYVYGERSIYFTDDATDPFCLKIENKKKDIATNKVWDNNNVLQIEVVYPNSPLTSYTSKTVASSYELDENDNLIPSGVQHRFDDPYTKDQSGNTTSYYWEQHFELIYPDKEDITDKNDNFSPEKFTETVNPFMQFLEWITDVAALRNTGSTLGETGSQSRVTQAELNKFIAEAHDHLDLYKLAAYYIFFLRFGLIDSVERNAQLKTYDGKHWHYEPWDMDIALGCANNGVIAYDPPLTRDTKAGGNTYAFSGRTTTQSNVLWDCLECWDYWANSVVPEVAEALYQAGLTYDNASKMFDEEYVEKWSETLYNESGRYKYIDATRNPKYRLYLNGARTSHRHWWLSKSMNYYDAKWSCGDFTKHSIQFRISKPQDISGYNVMKIYPTNNTFFKAQYGSKGDEIVTILGEGLTEASVEPGGEAQIDAFVQLEDKQPCFIFGASSIEKLDLSGLLTSSTNNVGRGYTDISFEDSYDNVLGASIKTLKLGAPCTPNIYTNPDETTYTSNLSIGQNGITAITANGNDALENLEFLDVNGWYNKQTVQGVSGWLSDIFSGTGYDRKNITTLYAMGCDMATEFKTSNAGNKFTDLRLPSTITTLEFVNSSWEDISFWKSTELSTTRAQYDKVSGIPSSINTIKFKGTTARNQCSLDMVLSWINNIETDIKAAHPSYTAGELENALWQVLSTKVIYAEQINWGTGTTKLYYKDIIRLSKIGNDGVLYNLRGYIIISDSANLTAIQLAELQNIFGEHVFDVGTTNTNLVVDQNSGFIRIGVRGTIIDSQTGAMYINEPNSVNLTATSFTLSSDTHVNYILDSEHNIQNIQDGEYLWALSNSENGDITNIVKSAYLQKRNNGGIGLFTEEGDYGDYSVWVSVYYIDSSRPFAERLQHDSVEINIIGVTYPEDFVFNVPTSPIRQFRYTQQMAEDVFGSTYALQAILPDAYIMSNSNQKYEFSIDKGSGYTATLKSIEYYISNIDTPSDNTGYMNSNELSAKDSNLYYIGTDENLGYTKDSVKGGITLQVIGAPSNTMKKYRLSARIKVGGKSPFTKTITIIVWNDNVSLVNYSAENPLYVALAQKYMNCYGLSTFTSNLYKSELLSLYGPLDLQSSGINSLLANTELSVFTYMKYVVMINLSGLTNITLTDLGTGNNNLDFSNIVNLRSVLLNGCTGLNGSVLDLEGQPWIQHLVASDTSLGVKLSQNSQMRVLQLGSPVSISIVDPVVLGDDGTSVTVQSSQNLKEIKLVNVNKTNVHGFTVFDILTNDN